MFAIKLIPESDPMTSDLLSSALALTRRSDFVFVSTLHDGNGFPDTRVMFNLLKLQPSVLTKGAAALHKPFASWLATNTGSQKVRHIRKDGRICLYYADTATFEGLTLQGIATEVQDPALRKVIWMDGWESYYPGGLDGGDFTLLHFSPNQGRYYQDLNVETFDASVGTGSLRP